MDLTDQTKELVFNFYTMSLDFDIAILKTGLSKEQAVSLKSDEDFMMRLRLEEAQFQTDLVTSLRGLLSSENEPTRLRAILELGKMKYKTTFNVAPSDAPLVDKPHPTIRMKGIAPH